jgi:hypothetical protein
MPIAWSEKLEGWEAIELGSGELLKRRTGETEKRGVANGGRRSEVKGRKAEVREQRAKGQEAGRWRTPENMIK